ncbi:energy transducer TonB [Sediminispirochaeta smaragdinae]|uniref:energy transducer TonB n=1 Tax=Sediminispirochaeta smaragdinae TaxID=55206 RepID=UPI0006746D6A|nr:energy transducer TonB [Sediminispirochaeta smaragdinae]
MSAKVSEQLEEHRRQAVAIASAALLHALFFLCFGRWMDGALFQAPSQVERQEQISELYLDLGSPEQKRVATQDKIESMPDSGHRETSPPKVESPAVQKQNEAPAKVGSESTEHQQSDDTSTHSHALQEKEMVPRSREGAAEGGEQAYYHVNEGSTETGEKVGADNVADVADLFLMILKNRISRNFTYPPIARNRGIEGLVAVRLSIAPNGTLEECLLQRSSGSSLLDKEALALLKSLFPFDIAPGEQIRCSIEVEYTLSDS